MNMVDKTQMEPRISMGWNLLPSQVAEIIVAVRGSTLVIIEALVGPANTTPLRYMLKGSIVPKIIITIKPYIT